MSSEMYLAMATAPDEDNVASLQVESLDGPDDTIAFIQDTVSGAGIESSAVEAVPIDADKSVPGAYLEENATHINAEERDDDIAIGESSDPSTEKATGESSEVPTEKVEAIEQSKQTKNSTASTRRTPRTPRSRQTGQALQNRSSRRFPTTRRYYAVRLEKGPIPSEKDVKKKRHSKGKGQNGQKGQKRKRGQKADGAGATDLGPPDARDTFQSNSTDTANISNKAASKASQVTSVSNQTFLRIKSAIFLTMEDSLLFVEGINSSYAKTGIKAVCAVFNSLEEAEAYLLYRSDNQPKKNARSTLLPNPPVGEPFESVTDEPHSKRIRSSVTKTTANEQDDAGHDSDDALSPTEKWQNMYMELVDFQEQNDGSFKIPRGKKYSKLNAWVKQQQKDYEEYINSQSDSSKKSGENDQNSQIEENIAALKDIGFVFDADTKREKELEEERKWNEMFVKLSHFKNQYGTLDVRQDETETELAAWAKKQKRLLAQFFKGNPDGKPNKLSEEQMKKLLSLGYQRPAAIDAGKTKRVVVDRSIFNQRWNVMLEELRNYKNINGHTKFPDNPTEEVGRIKRWVNTQRKEYKKLELGQGSSLTTYRLQKLNEVGLNFHPNKGIVPWETRMEQFRQFREEHGHLNVSVYHPELGLFVTRVRQRYKDYLNGKPNGLKEERVQQLAEMGFVFEAGKSPKVRVTVRKTWEERFQELIEFQQLNGHTIVPQNSGVLGDWVRMQRVAYKRLMAGRPTPLTHEKALKLSGIGFCFDASYRFKRSSS